MESARIAKWVGTPASLALHTVLFLACFLVGLFGVVAWESVLLVLTTAVSLEAIYLAIFIQMTMNAQAESLKVVEENVDEIQEDIEEVQEDIEEVQENIEEIQEDVDEIQEDIGEVVDLQSEETEALERQKTIDDLSASLQRLLKDIEKMKAQRPSPPQA